MIGADETAAKATLKSADRAFIGGSFGRAGRFHAGRDHHGTARVTK
jgi:hypothetical protein